VAGFAYGAQAGAVVQNAKLLAIDDSRLFVQQLVKAVVNSVDNATRFNDSILLYNLAEDYNGVLEVLNSELGNSLGQSSATSAAGQQDVLDVAKSVMDHYERNRFALDRKKKDTTQKLIKIKEAFVLYDAGKLDDALVVGAFLRSRSATDAGQTLESVQILPLAQDTDIVPVIKTAEDFKELDETITRNFDAVMLTAMNIIYALHQQLKESPYGDSSRQNVCFGFGRAARTEPVHRKWPTSRSGLEPS
jgi:nuclear pore complex protein Nup93